MTWSLGLVMRRYCIEPRTKKYKKWLFDTGLDALKTASKK